MVQTELSIIFAALAILTSLAGLGVAIHGLLFDQPDVVSYGGVALVLGITCFVGLLNTMDGDHV